MNRFYVFGERSATGCAVTHGNRFERGSKTRVLAARTQPFWRRTRCAKPAPRPARISVAEEFFERLDETRVVRVGTQPRESSSFFEFRAAKSWPYSKQHRGVLTPARYLGYAVGASCISYPPGICVYCYLNPSEESSAVIYQGDTPPLKRARFYTINRWKLGHPSGSVKSKETESELAPGGGGSAPIWNPRNVARILQPGFSEKWASEARPAGGPPANFFAARAPRLLIPGRLASDERKILGFQLAVFRRHGVLA